MTKKEPQTDTGIESEGMFGCDDNILQYMVEPDGSIELEEPPHVSKSMLCLDIFRKIRLTFKKFFRT